MHEGESIPSEEAVSASAETVETHEDETREETPVIDVHDAHHAANSWKEFFVHIATIVLGLLIAVGLEQTVEYFHHRYEVAETRKALEIERRININHFAMQTEEFHRFVPKLETDLAIFRFLKAHPHAPAEQWPGRFSGTHLGPSLTYADARWNTAKQDNVLVLMPGPEVQEYSILYGKLAGLNDNLAAKEDAIYESLKDWVQTPAPTRMSPEQIDHEIEVYSTALSLYYSGAVAQRVLNDRFPDFKPATTNEDELRIAHVQDGADDDARKVDEMKRRLRREDEAVVGGGEP
jgi:hypothetical protein